MLPSPNGAKAAKRSRRPSFTPAPIVEGLAGISEVEDQEFHDFMSKLAVARKEAAEVSHAEATATSRRRKTLDSLPKRVKRWSLGSAIYNTAAAADQKPPVTVDSAVSPATYNPVESLGYKPESALATRRSTLGSLPSMQMFAGHQRAKNQMAMHCASPKSRRKLQEFPKSGRLLGMQPSGKPMSEAMAGLQARR